MKQNLDIEQSQRLSQHLTPLQVRFVRLLEMSGPEIEDEVRRELADNPALEDNEVVGDRTEDYGETAEDMQLADFRSDDDVPSYRFEAHNHSADDAVYRREASNEPDSLADSLNSQLDLLTEDPAKIALAHYLVGNLDENGRLTRSLLNLADDVSIATGLDITRSDMADALDLVRTLDPPGVGAVDLRDCLLIQLRRIQPKTLAVKAATEIIDHHFDLFTKKHYDRLKTALGIDTGLLTEAVDVIRSLNPKPGNATPVDARDMAGRVTPDYFVTPVEDHPDRFTVSLNQNIPSLAVEESFKVDPEDKDGRMFVRRKRDEANAFIGLINRRTDTLMAVIKAIVAFQSEFFRNEDQTKIKPMLLRDIADLTGYDISVVSRATAGKYLATPAAVYPLKMFFNERSATTPEEDDTTPVEVINALREIIEAEDKRRPLSDRALTDKMAERGYKLARRTVTKHREKLGIPVSRLRKTL
ncbi:MAG: RNA polymerase factor sigma-54 [Bacteroidales bacterium]|nr:RNA polymerase factor sigma-54 [Bacteroidales bacterium]